MTIGENFSVALNDGVDLLAYSIYWSIKSGICQAHDDISMFKPELVNIKDVNRMREQNELGIQTIKLFSMPTEPGVCLYVLAENEQSARGAYLNEIGTLPKSIEDISHQIDRSFWIEDIGYKMVREMKDEILMFPAILFEYEKNKLEN
ncbi:hypothetical protein [Psychrobacillus psychrotolerans]|uniref:hypothetical protein n=1 Tax=Psychrobacillus psychrotolerans TaxID=126156 RepID=UPI003C73E104